MSTFDPSKHTLALIVAEFSRTFYEQGATTVVVRATETGVALMACKNDFLVQMEVSFEKIRFCRAPARMISEMIAQAVGHHYGPFIKI